MGMEKEEDQSGKKGGKRVVFLLLPTTPTYPLILTAFSIYPIRQDYTVTTRKFYVYGIGIGLKIENFSSLKYFRILTFLQLKMIFVWSGESFSCSSQSPAEPPFSSSHDLLHILMNLPFSFAFFPLISGRKKYNIHTILRGFWWPLRNS